MVAERGPWKETKVQSGTLKLVDTSDLRSSYSSSTRNPSSLDNDQPNITEDHDDNRFLCPSAILETRQTIRQPCLADLEKNGVYDREAILDYLACLAMPENGGNILHDLVRLNEGSASSVAQLPDEFSRIRADEKLTLEDRHYLLVDEMRETLKEVPDSLLHLITAWVRPGDSGIPSGQTPDWLDVKKLKRGQEFAQNNIFAALFAAIVGLLPVFSFEDGLKPMIFTGNSTMPFATFKRYLRSGLTFRRWYTEDIWDKGTRASKDLSIVRAMHSATRKRLEALTIDEVDAATAIPNANCPTREMMMKDFIETCEAPAMGQCPYILGRGNPHRPKSINQADMAITQWSFAGLLVSYPHRFGVHHATDEDLEAFCHLWRNLGYQLGIEDEYNFYRGTLEDVRQRGRELVDTWIKPNLREITPEWEHMSRSLIDAMAALLPCRITFEMATIYVMETLDLPMPRLYATLGYMDRFVYNLMTGLFHYGMKVPGVTSIANAVINLLLNQAENYTPDQLEAVRIKLGG